MISPLAGTLTPARQGNAARARTNPGQPSKFRKGLGKGTHKSLQAKRSRTRDRGRVLMDQDQLDEETIKRILRFLVRAASRHEQQLTSLEADRSCVFFLEVGHHGLVGMLVQARPGTSNSRLTGSRGLRSSGPIQNGMRSKRKLCQPAGTT